VVDHPRIDVVAALIKNSRGDVLLGQRPPGRPMAGFWEFPGGKRNAGERREDALARELREELGIRIVQAESFMQLEHTYPELHVSLDIWRVSTYVGTPKALDGQLLRWVAIAELGDTLLLPADRPIVERLMRGKAID
jgi:8-oxo-dGTP diphosphatase